MSYKTNRKGFLQYLGIKHHEYWSWWWFSFPIWPQWIWYAIRLKNPTWFTAINPAIEHSGYTEESKMSILNILPKENVPETIFIECTKKLPDTILAFPFIAKPDIGGRGRKIKIINSLVELQAYHDTVGEDYLIQKIIPYELELGIFYVKIPSQKKGKIISLTEKEFLKVIGDGKKTIRELLLEIKRAKDQIVRLSDGIDFNIILPAGEEFLVEPIGNHSRGTVFLNKNEKINPLLEANFEKITKQIKGFHYGRFDFRVRSWEDLYEGNEIYILELNGLTSMDTHIFDPHFRLRDVLPVLIQNCRYCFLIARENLRNNIPSTPFGQILKKSLAFFKE